MTETSGHTCEVFPTADAALSSAVVYECHAEQKLECPYGSNDRRLQKVWCKRDANNESCCVGFSLSEKIEHLRVQEKDTAFTVTVKNLPQGDGVYWCGLRDLRGPNTIFKLAEKKLYSESVLLRINTFGLSKKKSPCQE